MKSGAGVPATRAKRPVSETSQTQAVTISQLIEALLREHAKSTTCGEISFCSIFFTTYRTFLTPAALFDRLQYQYNRIAAKDVQLGHAALHQVVSALRCWITQHWLSQERGSVVTAVSRFLLDITAPSPTAAVAKHALLALQLRVRLPSLYLCIH